MNLDLPAAPGTCPDVLTMFSRHLEDEISADLCAAMERHLEACGRCRGICGSLKRTLALCRTSGASAEIPASVRASVKMALRTFLAGSA
jgi:RNA polymerase sigma-70 factor (ECF subfamily)